MRLSCFVLLFALAAATTQSLDAGRIGWIKTNCRDGDVVEAEGIVTAAFADCIYIEDSDRTAGIRLRDFQGSEGVLYAFSSNGATTGLRLQTGTDGERELIFLPNTPICGIPVDPITPLAMPNASVGGSTPVSSRS